jgi:hypothetical protein
MAGEQPRVEHHDLGDPPGMLHRQSQSDRSAPIVHHYRRGAQIELLQQRRDRLGVPVIAVPIQPHRLVRAAESGQVGRDAPVARVTNRRDHLAPQKRPCRLAVAEDHRFAVALVEMGQAQPVELAVARREGEIRKSVQQLVWGAEGVGHGAKPTPIPPRRA